MDLSWEQLKKSIETFSARILYVAYPHGSHDEIGKRCLKFHSLTTSHQEQRRMNKN